MKLLMTLSDMDRFWSHRVDLARAIVARGWRLVLATEGAQEDERLGTMGVSGASWPRTRGFASHPAIIWHLVRLIRAEEPDLVHAVTLRQAFYMALALRITGKGVPAIYTIAGLGSLFSAPTPVLRLLRPIVVAMMRWGFSHKSVCVIFQNEENREAFISLKIISPEQTALIRGSGVDTQRFCYTPEPQVQFPVVLYAGRLLRDKGVYEFVEASRLLRARGLTARFIIAGDFYPKNPHSLAPELVHHWVDEGILEWDGPSADMPQTLRMANIAVLPSYHEGLPKFLLEAAATGRAIVASNIAGCRDVVKDGHNGLLVAPRDASALADAIAALLTDPEKRRTMGENGRRLVERDFAVESVVSDTLDVYDRVLEGRNR